jgi:hypothetical protein
MAAMGQRHHSIYSAPTSASCGTCTEPREAVDQLQIGRVEAFSTSASAK